MNDGKTPQPVRILIVDDDRDSAECLQMIVSRHGYAVRVAYDGMQALAVAAEFSPEIAILDICIPELNGFQVAHRLRRTEHAAPIRLVAMTGLMGYADSDSSQYEDFDDHLIKPVHPKDILKLLSKIGTTEEVEPLERRI